MKRILALSLFVGLLAGCATMIEGQTQPITILTPGAEGAECYLYNEDMRYKVRAGQKDEVMKSNHDLTVECLAPGNRQRTVIVKSQLEPATLLNATNAVVPGVAYDHFSRGMYAYPETVTVDFSREIVASYPLPAYMNTDVHGVYVGEVEGYQQSMPSVPGDAYDVQPVIRKKTGPSLTDSPFGDRTQPAEK